MPSLASSSFLLILIILSSLPPSNRASSGQSFSSSGGEFLNKLSDTFNLDPYLHPTEWNDDVTQTEEEFVSRGEAERYLSLLRFIDARKSPLVQKFKRIVKSDPTRPVFDSETSVAETLSRIMSGDLSIVEEIVLKLKNQLDRDEAFRSGDYERSPILMKLIGIMQRRDKVNKRPDFIDKEVSPMADTNRTLCNEQYGAFVEPITNKIYNAIVDLICAQLPRPIICTILDPWLPDKEMPPWGPRMIDAMTKVPHSIRDGQRTWLGAYDYCELTEVSYMYNLTVEDSVSPELREFTGKYCRLDLVPDNYADTSFKLQLGVCVPSFCHHTDVVNYITNVNVVLRAVLFILQSNVTFAFCGVEDVDQWSDASYIANFVIVAVAIGIILIATIYDGFFRKHAMNKQIIALGNDLDQAELERDEKGGNEESKKRCLRKMTLGKRYELLLVGFSAYSNMRRIFTTHRKPGDIPVLNGIRFLSFCYVIWGQTFVYGPIYFESWVTANILYALRHIPTQFVYQAVINFHLAGDSFLLISGILLSYWYLKKHENIKKNCRNILSNAIMSLLHRYWRLVPVMMMCLMIFTCTYKFFSNGPMFPHEDQDGENCKVNWWVPLTMTHNLVLTSEQCFGHAWFVPMIFQLHLAALIVLVHLVVKPIIGYILLVCMYIAHIGAAAGLSYNLREAGDFGGWYDDYFVTPWCRAGPFIIGLAYGIVFYHKSKTGVKINTFLNLFLWVLSLFTIAAVSFWSLDQYKDLDEHKDLPDKLHRWSMDALVAYDTLARSAWGLALGWIAFACHFGHGGVVESLLTWSAFTPVSRLVYPAMIMHGMMIFNMVYSTRHAIVVEGYHSSYASLAHTIVVMLTGLVMSLVWHYPLSIGIERALICPDRVAWIRAGRHSRKRLQDLTDEFFTTQTTTDNQADSRPPLFAVSGDYSAKPIPNVNYVRASPADLANLGLSDIVTVGKNGTIGDDKKSLSDFSDKEDNEKRRESVSSKSSSSSVHTIVL